MVRHSKSKNVPKRSNATAATTVATDISISNTMETQAPLSIEDERGVNAECMLEMEERIFKLSTKFSLRCKNLKIQM